MQIWSISTSGILSSRYGMYFGTLIVNLILVIAYSKGKMVATPHMKDQMILIMKRDFYKTGQMASFFKKMRIRKGFQLMYTRWRSLPKLRSVRQFETPSQC